MDITNLTAANLDWIVETVPSTDIDEYVSNNFIRLRGKLYKIDQILDGLYKTGEGR